jgi:hypothetical protein
MSETTAEKTGETTAGEGSPDLLSMIAGDAAEEVSKVTGNLSKAEKEARRAVKRAEKEAAEKAEKAEKEAEKAEAAKRAASTTITLPAGSSREKVTPKVTVYPVGVAVCLSGNVYRVRVLSRNTADGTARVAVGTGPDCTIPVNPTAERVLSRDILPGEGITVVEGLARFTADHNAVCDSLANHPIIGADVAKWEGVMVNAAVTGERDDVFPFAAGECVRGTFSRTPDGWTFTREGETAAVVIQGGTNKGAVWTFSADVATWEASAVVFRSLPPATLPRARAMFRETFTAFSHVVGVMARMGGADAVKDTLRGIIDTMRAYPPVTGE